MQQNFTIRTGETAFLFLQHFIAMLKAGGRAAVVIKNTFLSNTDNAFECDHRKRRCVVEYYRSINSPMLRCS